MSDSEKRIAALEAERDRLHTMLDVVRSFAGEMDLEVLLGRIVEETSRLVGADRSSLFLYEEETDELWSKIAQGLDTQTLRFKTAGSLAGYAVRSGRAVNIPDAYKDERFNPDVDAKTGYRTRSMLCVPMKSTRDEMLGVFQVLNKLDGGPFTAEDEELLYVFASHAAVAVENAQLYSRIEELFDSVVRTSSAAIDERDPATAGHSQRVSEYAVRLARVVHDSDGPPFTHVQYSREQIKQLRYAGLLHDVGKIGVREHILSKKTKLANGDFRALCERIRRKELERQVQLLRGGATGSTEISEDGDVAGLLQFLERVNSPGILSEEEGGRLEELHREGVLTDAEVECLSVARGNLTKAEWKDMKSHPERSFHMLKDVPWPEHLASVPFYSRAHHEKLNGKGYPEGLSGEELPLDVRILAVVDIYDALSARDRPYKPAIPHEKCRSIMRGMAGRGEISAPLVELFFKEFPAGGSEE